MNHVVCAAGADTHALEGNVSQGSALGLARCEAAVVTEVVGEFAGVRCVHVSEDAVLDGRVSGGGSHCDGWFGYNWKS